MQEAFPIQLNDIPKLETRHSKTRKLEAQDAKKPDSFESGFLMCWRSGRDSNPRPPA